MNILAARSRRLLTLGFAVAFLAAPASALAQTGPPYLTEAFDYAGGNFTGPRAGDPTPPGTSLLSMTENTSSGTVSIEGWLIASCGSAIVTRTVRPKAGRRISFAGTGRRRYGSLVVRFRYRISGTVGPGGGSGRSTAAVRLSEGKRVKRCGRRSTWKLKPTSPLSEPFRPISPARSATYAGVSQDYFGARRRVRWPVMLRVARDGRSLRTLFAFKLTCDAGRIRTDAELLNSSPRIRLGADGRFSSVERYRVVFSDVIARGTARISGRFYDDGAQGVLSVVESYRDRKTRRHIETCGSTTSTAAADDPKTRWYAAALGG